MNKYFFLFVFFVIITFWTCKDDSHIERTIAKRLYFEYLSCFPDGTVDFDKSEVSLELSGVAYYHDSLFLVSEQRVPGTSSFFCSSYKIPFRRKNFTPVGDANVLNSTGFADLALTPYQRYLFAVTSFNSINENPFGKYTYNMLFYKRLNPPGPYTLAYSEKHDDMYSSVVLYDKFKKALRTKLYKNGPPYFEISGIAAIRDNYLLFSIGKMGQSRYNCESVNIIIGAKYQIIDNEFSFVEEIKELYRFEPDIELNLRGPMVLSSIEYDKYNNRLYLLCAYEKGERDIDLGGYLWVLPIRDYVLKKPPTLVVDDDGLPISFVHKPGGITVLDKNQILIVFDDNRVAGSESIIDRRTQFTRKLSQAAYLILELRNE